MINIRSAINTLKEPSTTTSSKLQCYSTIKDFLEDVTKNYVLVQNKDVVKEIFNLVNLDVRTSDSNVQKICFHIIKLLLKYSLPNNMMDSLPVAYVDLAFDDDSNCKEAASECLTSCLKLIIANNICDVQPLFLKLSDKSLNDKVCNLLFNVYSNLNTKSAVIFFYQKNIHTMFETSNLNVRDGLIKLNNDLLPKYKIILLDNDKFDEYKKRVKERYVPRIVELRCAKDPNWSNLFKFILKCFGKLLHIQVDLINDLLKAVESAFRSANLDDRFEAFGCWKELIDNYSLDMNRLCGAKQMKLLVTPLKTNISTNDHIIYKRFEVWVHLFNILQDKAFSCLTQFLQFCFGDPSSCSKLDNALVLNQNVQLYLGSTQVLLEVMGHYKHDPENPCFQFSQPSLKLQAPLVNENFVNVSNILMHSVIKCSSVILKWMDVEHVPNVICCLWGSLLSKIKSLNEDRQEELLENLVTKLTQLTKENENNGYRYIFKPLVELLIAEDLISKHIFKQKMFFPLLKCLFDEHLAVTLTDAKFISEFIKHGLNYNDIDEWLKEAYDVISTSKSNCVMLLWMECVDFFQLCNAFVGQEFRELVVNFMAWPLVTVIPNELHLDFIKRWKIMFKYIAKIYPTETEKLIRKVYCICSERNSHFVCAFYKAFYQILQNPDISFEKPLLDLTHNLITIVPLKKSDVSLLLPTVIYFMNKMTLNKDTSNFTLLCSCCITLLRAYKQTKLLYTLDEILDKTSLALPTSLVKVIRNLKDNVRLTDIVTSILKKVDSNNRDSEKSTSPSRGKKLIAMVGQKIPTEPSSLLLFGQNVMSPNHAGIRGSHLKDEKNLTPKKIANKIESTEVIPVDDDNDANYVPINTHYQFDPKKLSDHQLDVIKSRKSDIPALYQDLSQSQSHFGSSSNDADKTKLDSEQVNEKLVDLHVRNPSQEQIEAMIRSDDSSKKLAKKKGRVEKELMKLKLDLVGGEFVQKIDLLGNRKTRRNSEQNHKKVSAETTPKTPRGRRKKSVSPVLEKTESNDGAEQKALSEDVIESSQNHEIKVLNSEFEEIVSKLQSSSLEVEAPPETIKVEEKDTCDMSTETLDDVGTPKKSVDIPTSPVQSDTPRRTSELIMDTVDISPIKFVEENQVTEDLFESEALDVIPTEKYESEAFDVIPMEKENEIALEVVQQKTFENDLQITLINKRFKKTSSIKAFVPVNKRISKIVKSPVIFSAQTHRIMKMMQKCEKKLEFHEQINEDQAMDGVSDEDDANQEFLKFVRELPSPKASPRCSILKRKACEMMDEGLSPPRKKRVNFPDPPLTSKVMYVPDVNEHNRVGIDPLTLFGNIDDVESCEEQSEETQPVETQGSVEMIDVQLLNASEPFFKDLVECQDNVIEIVPYLSDPMFAEILLRELQSKDIKTVGDLARLTEVDISRLPIKSPKLMNLTDVLSKHKIHKLMKQEISEQVETKENDVGTQEPKKSTPTTVQTKPTRRIPLKPVTESDCSKDNTFNPLLLEPVVPNPKAEDVLNKLLKELDSVKLLAKKEGTKLTALCKLLTEIVEPSELLQILQDNTAFSLSSLIEERDWPKILKEVITAISLKKFVAMLCSIPTISPASFLQILVDESIETFKDNNSPELQRTIARVVEFSPPTLVLGHLTLEKIVEETLGKCIDSNLPKAAFFAEAFKTFSPTIDDVICSFRHINVVDLQEGSVQRNEEDLLEFIKRVLTVVDASKACLLIPKENMLPLFTRDELTDGIIKTSTCPRDFIQSCEKLVQKLPRSKPMDDRYESLLFSLFDKIPTSDLCRYFSKHLSTFADTVQSKENL